jgi:hypothetical protein
MPKDRRTIASVPRGQIATILRENQLKREMKQECPVCLKSFMITRKWQKFCSTGCRNAWHTYVRCMSQDDYLRMVEAIRKETAEQEAEQEAEVGVS